MRILLAIEGAEANHFLESQNLKRDFSDLELTKCIKYLELVISTKHKLKARAMWIATILNRENEICPEILITNPRAYFSLRKDHIRREILSQTKCPEKWGFLSEIYKEVGCWTFMFLQFSKSIIEFNAFYSCRHAHGFKT